MGAPIFKTSHRPGWARHIGGAIAALALALGFCAALGAAPGTASAGPAVPADPAAGTPYLDLDSAAEYIEDRDGRLSLADAAGATPAGRTLKYTQVPAGGLNLGFANTTVWLRFTLAAGATAAPRFLEVRSASLDRLQLYSPDGVERPPQRSGDALPFSIREYPHRHPLFRLDPAPGTATTYYLKISTEGVLNVPLRLWGEQAMLRAHESEYLLLGAYFGIALLMALYNLLLYAAIRDRAYLAYVVYVLSLSLLLAHNTGLAQQYLWPDWPLLSELAHTHILLLTLIAMTAFVRLFLDTRGLAPRLDRLLLALLGAGVAMMLLRATLLSYTAAYLPVQLLAVVFIVVLFTVLLATMLKGSRPAGFLFVAVLVMAVGGLANVLRNLGAPVPSFLAEYGMLIGSLFEILILSLGLADRIATLRRERAQAQRQAIEVLRRSEQELEARVNERTVQIEMSNQLLRGSEEKMRHLATHDPLTGLPNRAYLRERLPQALAKARRDASLVAVMLVDLDHFKHVNDSLGHDAGDRMLVEAARRLQACLRAQDTVARFGGDEFVLVLEELHTPEQAAAIAHKAVEALRAPLELAGRAVAVGASIGISLFPDDAQEPDFLLKYADAAMYAAKSATRNSYRFYRHAAAPESAATTTTTSTNTP